MGFEIQLLAGLVLSLAVVYWITPVAIRIADRFEFYDVPAGYKGHRAPTPYLGGTAVMAGFLVTTLALTGDWGRTLPVVGGALVLWALGTLDDRRPVPPQVRVAVEALLAAVLWAADLGWNLGFGSFVDLTATVLWVVAVVNAFNLFDNADGAAGAMAAVVASGVAILGLILDDIWLAIVAAALAGACVGFLPHNMRSPARIFLGDGGSMPIGFTVAALVTIGTSGAALEWRSLAVGLLLVGIPALDTALVIRSRRRRGVPVVTAGRDHLTHRSLVRLRTAKTVALTLGGVQAVVSAIALVAVRGSSTLIVAAVALYLVAAGTAIALLDGRGQGAEAGTEGRDAASEPGSDRAATPVPLGTLLLVVVGVLLGISPFFGGYYDSSYWVPASLALAAVVAAAAMARPPSLTRAAVVALAALGALGAWALASLLWADSIQQAVLEGNRLLGYALLLAALLLAMRVRARAIWAFAAVAGAALVVAADSLVHMLGSDATGAFVAGRLDAPLGYVNGQASFYLIALWICLAAAEQRRRPLVAGAGLAATTLLGCFLVLSQSRGVTLAAAVTVVLVLALVPGRLRRAWALLTVGAGVAAATPVLVDVYASRAGGVDGSAAHAAGRAALIAAAVTGLVWWAASLAVARSGPRLAALRRTAAAAVGVVLAAGALVALASHATVRETISDQYSAFVKQRVEPQESASVGDSSRLVTGAGNRYDYWRIAWNAWEDEPLAGTGAGAYQERYFLKRATTESIRQPHSLGLQTLSELGIVGATLLLVLLGTLGAGAWRVARSARGAGEARFVAVAAIGSLTAWLVHTSVDWIHLLPGLTGIALIAAAALLSRPVEREQAARTQPRDPIALRRIVLAVGVGLLLAVASISFTRQGLTEHFTERGQDALPARPADALVEAERALRLDREAIDAYYVKSAALARFGRGAAARAVLLEATRREPRDFLTWTLVGDLEVRMGDLEAARRSYGRALRLNPRDESLKRLVADPAAILRAPGGAGGTRK